MASHQFSLHNLFGEEKLTDLTDRIRASTGVTYQELMNAEASAFIGAALFGRSDERSTHHNGSRPRMQTTAALGPGFEDRRNCGRERSSPHC